MNKQTFGMKILGVTKKDSTLEKIKFFLSVTRDANFESFVYELHNFKSFTKNSQMTRRPIFISDSRETKEWPCFIGQLFFLGLF